MSPMKLTALKAAGCRLDMVRNRQRYIMSEHGRAVVGPIRHARRFGWKKRGQVAGQSAVPGGSRLVTMADMGNDLAKVMMGIRENLAQAFPTPPAPQDERSRYRKVSDWWLERYYSEAWHKGFRNTIADVLYVMVLLAAGIMFIRGMAWAVSL